MQLEAPPRASARRRLDGAAWCDRFSAVRGVSIVKSRDLVACPPLCEPDVAGVRVGKRVSAKALMPLRLPPLGRVSEREGVGADLEPIAEDPLEQHGGKRNVNLRIVQAEWFDCCGRG